MRNSNKPQRGEARSAGAALEADDQRSTACTLREEGRGAVEANAEAHQALGRRRKNPSAPAANAKKNLPNEGQTWTTVGLMPHFRKWLPQLKKASGVVIDNAGPHKELIKAAGDMRNVVKRVLREQHWKPMTNAQLRARCAKKGAVLSKRTLKRIKREAGWIGRTAVQKPEGAFYKINRDKRLAVARARMKYPADFWHNVIWIDQTAVKSAQDGTQFNVDYNRIASLLHPHKDILLRCGVSGLETFKRRRCSWR